MAGKTVAPKEQQMLLVYPNGKVIVTPQFDRKDQAKEYQVNSVTIERVDRMRWTASIYYNDEAGRNRHAEWIITTNVCFLDDMKLHLAERYGVDTPNPETGLIKLFWTFKAEDKSFYVNYYEIIQIVPPGDNCMFPERDMAREGLYRGVKATK